MTAETSNYVRVAPRKEPAPAPAAAAPDEATDAPLRAQPRARARTRRMVTTATGAVAEKRAARRVAATAGKGASAPTEVGRDNAWRAAPPSLAELAARAQRGPVVVRHGEAGKTVEEDPDWHPLVVLGWRAWAWAVVGVASAAYGSVWVASKPSRTAAVAVVVAIVWALAVAGGTPGGEG